MTKDAALALPTTITNFLGVETALGPSATTYEKALEGRINLRKGLLGGAEKEIASRVEPKKNGKSYTKERVYTNPLGSAAITSAAISPIVLTRAFLLPSVLKKIRERQLTLPLENVYAFNNHPLIKRMIPEAERMLPLSEKLIAEVSTYKHPKNLAISLLLPGGLVGAGALYHRHKQSKDLLRQERDASKSYVRSKLRESFLKESGVNPALLDDAAFYLAKATQLVEEKVKTEPRMRRKQDQTVKNEISEIQKQADVVTDALYAIRNHPKFLQFRQSILNSPLVRTVRDVDAYGKALYPRMRAITMSPAVQIIAPGPGPFNVATGAYAATAAQAREMIRSPKYQRFMTSIINALPK